MIMNRNNEKKNENTMDIKKENAMLRLYVDMDDSCTKTSYGYSALHTAVISRDIKAVQALTGTAACDLESRDSMGFTALHLATLQGNEELVQLLVQAGSDINSRTKEGMTSLHISSEHSGVEPDIISALATAGSCDVNTRNKLGRTALHLAAKLGNTQNLKVLLDAGCDRNIKDKLGFTAVGLAFKFNQKGSADILLHYKPRRSLSSSKDSVLDENQNEPVVECKGIEEEEQVVKDCVCTRFRNVTHARSLRQSKQNQTQFQELWDKVLLKLMSRDVKGEALSWKIYHLLVTIVTRKRDKLDGLTYSNLWKIPHVEVFERKLLNTIPSWVSFIHYPFSVYSVASFDTRPRKRGSFDLTTQEVFGKNDRYNLETDLLLKLLIDLKGTLLCFRNPRPSFCFEQRDLPAALTSCDLQEETDKIPVFEDFKAFAQILKELCNCKSDEMSLQKCTNSEAECLEGIHRKSNIILIIRDTDKQEHRLSQIKSEIGADKAEDFLSCLERAINTRNTPPQFVEDFLEFFLQNSHIFTFCLNSKYSLFRTILDKYLSTSSPWNADKIARLFLQVCVALSNDKRLLFKCAGDVMKQGLLHEHCNAVSLGNCILVRMGLLKGEYDVDVVLNLKGPLLALEHVFGQEYFPRDLASTFASFLSKSSPKLFGLEELRLRALASAVTREVLPTSAPEAESDTGRSFKRICDIAALEQDRELLSKCVDSLCWRAFVKLKCNVWPIGESLLMFLGLLKSEFTIEIVRNLQCALKLLLPVVNQSYFPQELKEMFLFFLQKPNPALNSCSCEVDEIIHLLVSFQSNL